jgi:hypothetical protein
LTALLRNRLTRCLHASDAQGSNGCRVNHAGRDVQPVAGHQVDRLPVTDEPDAAARAVQHLVIRVRVLAVAVAPPVGPPPRRKAFVAEETLNRMCGWPPRVWPRC